MKASDPSFLAPFFFFGFQTQVFEKSQFLDILTTTETCRPQNLNIYVKLDVESELLVKNCQFLHLESIL